MNPCGEFGNWDELVETAIGYLDNLISTKDPHCKTQEARRVARLTIKLMDLQYALETSESAVNEIEKVLDPI